MGDNRSGCYYGSPADPDTRNYNSSVTNPYIRLKHRNRNLWRAGKDHRFPRYIQSMITADNSGPACQHHVVVHYHARTDPTPSANKTMFTNVGVAINCTSTTEVRADRHILQVIQADIDE